MVSGRGIGEFGGRHWSGTAQPLGLFHTRRLRTNALPSWVHLRPTIGCPELSNGLTSDCNGSMWVVVNLSLGTAYDHHMNMLWRPRGSREPVRAMAMPRSPMSLSMSRSTSRPASSTSSISPSCRSEVKRAALIGEAAELQGCRAVELQGCRAAELQGCRAAAPLWSVEGRPQPVLPLWVGR